MFEVKDPRIKLFGKTIELPEMEGGAAPPDKDTCGDAAEEDESPQVPPYSCNPMKGDGRADLDEDERESRKKNQSIIDEDITKEENRVQPLTTSGLKDSNVTPLICEESTSPSGEEEATAMESSKTEEDQSDTSNSQDKTLKKPDKILPCPRCNSMETKFCYFNNYNVNQPRHFCKNCQRYWTAGGSMRNVPVGAGRRKNKSAPSQFRYLTGQEVLQNSQTDIPNVFNNSVLNPNGGAVLTFNSDMPLCDSMTSVLSIADKEMSVNSSSKGFNSSEEGSVPHGRPVSGDEHLNGSSPYVQISKDGVGKNGLSELLPNFHAFPPHVPGFPGSAWHFPWNSVQWSSAISPQTINPANFPTAFFPAAPPPFWGCAMPRAWNVPWVFPPTPTCYHSPTPECSSPNSPTLGKHSRDDDVLKTAVENDKTRKDSSREKCLWIPKTLRIDDPEEAAKSSIWETLGIQHCSVEPGGKGGGHFKPFRHQSKSNEKSHASESSHVLTANPAALSRSVSFRESS